MKFNDFYNSIIDETKIDQLLGSSQLNQPIKNYITRINDMAFTRSMDHLIIPTLEAI